MGLREKIEESLRWQLHRTKRHIHLEKHELRYLFFEVSRRCNLRCLYCGSDCTVEERENELSVGQWKQIIRDIARDFDSSRIMVAVTGGEPLFREGIYEIMSELRDNGFPYGMVCNSMLLDDAAAKKLVECGICSISLSMDAPADLNDRIRGQGTSAAVKRAIGHLRSNGYRGILEILSTLTKPAIYRLEEMQVLVDSLGVDRWRVAPVMPIGRMREHPDLLPNSRDIRVMLEFVKSRRESLSEGVKPEFGEEGFVGRRFEGVVRPYLCQCRAGINVAGIRYDGKVGACPEISSEFDQGDILKDSLKIIWEERYQVFRDRSWTRSQKPCSDCKEYKNCQGGAMHLYQKPGEKILRCFYEMCKQDEALRR